MTFMLKLAYKTIKTKKGNNKYMETQNMGVEAVTKSELLELASWNRQRTIEQLRGFISRRSAALEDYDFEDDV